jgi:TolB-like protein
MGLDNTITEQDLDATSQQFVQSFRNDGKELEPDLAVDGLSESIIAKLMRLITFRRS